MLIGGKKLIERNSVPVTIKRPSGNVTLTLTSLPLGWEERLDAVGLASPPSPPLKPLLNADRTVVLNPLTKRAEITEDRGDPAYLRARSLYYNRSLSLKARELLRGDPQVMFDASEPHGSDAKAWAAYADSLVEEFKSSGLSLEELQQLCEIGDEIATTINTKSVVDGFLLSHSKREAEAPASAS